MIERSNPLCAFKKEHTRSFREHKYVILEEEELHDRTGQLVVCLNEEQGHSNSSLETTKQKLELSLGSRSFLHRVSDQVRKQQKTVKNIL